MRVLSFNENRLTPYSMDLRTCTCRYTGLPCLLCCRTTVVMTPLQLACLHELIDARFSLWFWSIVSKVVVTGLVE